MADKKMTVCKSCGKEIAKSAKTCPSCGAKNKKPFYKAVWFWVLIILLLAMIGSCGKSDSDKNPQNIDTPAVTESKNADETKSVDEDTTEVPTEAPTEAPIVYEEVSVSTMMDALGSNALKAKDTYDGKHLAITGKLSVIDSNGDYISVFRTDDDFAFIGVQCFIKDDAQLEDVMSLNIGDEITVKGEITDVGEVLGYSMKIEEIVK